jgi:conjugative relaxase-like TrwC/TraI family protein
LVARATEEPAVMVDARLVASTAAAARVDPGSVYGPGAFAVALARAPEKVDVRKAGADGQVSPPKSVSLLWAFGDPHLRSEVLAAHRTAVGAAVSYLEQWAGHGLRGHQGDGQRAARIRTDGLIIAAFEHLTSRADDPQLHTHLVVANLVRGVDGRWSALDTRALFRQQRTAGYLYQAVLRGQLTARLGVGWTPVRNGLAEIAGVSPRLIREFAVRRRQIEARLDGTGASGFRASRVACLATRPAKTGRTLVDLQGEWRARAARYVGDATVTLRATLGLTVAPSVADVDMDALAGHVVGPGGITAKQTGFDRGELTRHLLDLLPAGTALTHRDAEALVDELLTHPDVLHLADRADGARRHSTLDLVATEKATLRLARRPSAVPVAAVAPRVYSAGLSAEQLAMVVALASSASSVDVVLGPAGSGKTAALAAAADHWEGLGVPVLGAALAAVAARRLEDATGIQSTSLARLLHRVEQRAPLDPRTVVLLDEAAMVGSRHYLRLLSAVTDAGGKLVAVGDRAQLVEIDAGGMLAALARQHLRAELTGNQRQRHPWQRAALDQLRSGDIPAALSAYRTRGHLHTAPDHDTVRAAIAGQYLDARQACDDPFALIALATTRRDTAALNAAIRDRLRDSGCIGAEDTTLCAHDGHMLRVATRDLVLVTRNDHQRGLLNGTRGRITRIDPASIRMTIDDGRQVRVPAAWAADRLVHAYALTLHKAQGLTVDVALIDATGVGDRNAGYVALSRARSRTEIHVCDPDALDGALSDDPFQRGPSDRVRPHVALEARLRELRTQQLAVEQFPDTERASRTSGLGR